MIKYFEDLKIQTSDAITILLSIELEDQTFLTEDDLDEYMQDIEDNYNDVLTGTDYLYLLDLAFEKLDGEIYGDE